MNRLRIQASHRWYLPLLALVLMVALPSLAQTGAAVPTAPLQVLAQAQGGSATLLVGSTTSTEQSGLFSYLLPLFVQASGIQVHVVAIGTGQALDLGRRGDVDVLCVHDRPAEDRFVAEGYATRRYDLMYNDFVLIGPRSDPAQVAGARDVLEALQRIKARQASFVSRGDRSGTYEAELRLWNLAGIDIRADHGPWYRDTGTGMGPALNIAAAMDAYILSDRGTWIAFRNRQSLAIVKEGDSRLRNDYGLLLVNPQRHPHVKAAAGQQFIDWLVSAAGQRAIANYKIQGEQLFFPDARP